MTTATTNKHQKLLKILIGAAWIDNVIEPQEREYLRRVAIELDLVEDPEIALLLSEIKRVTPQECYSWIEEYTSENPNITDYYDLLEKISYLIYSDNYVDVRESRLLEKLQICDPRHKSCTNVLDSVIKKIRTIYKQAISQ